MYYFMRKLLILSVFGLVVNANGEPENLQQQIDAMQRQLETLQQEHSKTQTAFDKNIAQTLGNLKVNGYLSVGASWLDEDVPSNTLYQREASYQSKTYKASMAANSWAGFHMRYEPVAGSAFVVQFVADNGISIESELAARIEWLFYQQSLGAGFSMQLGRIRSPVFQDSKNYYVGLTYPTVKPNWDIYRTLPVNVIDGIAFSHNKNVGQWWLETEVLLWGTATLESLYEVDSRVDDISGLAFTASNNHWSLRAGFFRAQEKYQGSLLVGRQPVTANTWAPVYFETKVVDRRDYYTAAARFDNGAWYSNIEALVIDAKDNTLNESRRFYWLLGHHFGDWLPYVGFAKTQTTNTEDLASQSFNGNTQDLKSFLAKHQTTYSAGFRYNLLANVVIKTELQLATDFKGSIGLFSPLAKPEGHIFIADFAIQAAF